MNNTCSRPQTRQRRNRGFFAPSFENLINEFMNTSVGNIITHKDVKYTSPAVNIEKQEDGYSLYFALPGLTKTDIEIKIDEDVLIVSGKKEADTDALVYRLKEFNYGVFTRKFTLDKDIDQSSINASFVDGILKIDLAKKPVDPPKTISIK